jgi:hypothetical protein
MQAEASFYASTQDQKMLSSRLLLRDLRAFVVNLLSFPLAKRAVTQTKLFSSWLFLRDLRAFVVNLLSFPLAKRAVTQTKIFSSWLLRGESSIFSRYETRAQASWNRGR